MTGQENWADWLIVRPVGVVETIAPSLPYLDVGEMCSL